MFGAPPVTFVNGIVLAAGRAACESLRVRRGRVDAIGQPPHRGDLVVDVDGSLVIPGLVNAHDHLELNSFKRLKWRDSYANASEWIADFQPRFAADADLALARPETTHDRVWVGGLKNLLSGVTTVSHHNPMHAPLRRRFPVRVVRRFGISHSLHIDGPAVATSHARTPAAWPWIIHAAEGVDTAAAEEIDRLDALGCLRANTVLVHGVAIDRARADHIVRRGGSLVWCPSSNAFLFGSTADARPFDVSGRLAVGSDSRLSAAGDLLDEINAARATGQVSAEGLFRAVTRQAAAMLRLPHAGVLTPGGPADIAVIRRSSPDPFESLARSRRHDVRLTMIAGRPLVGDMTMRGLFDGSGEPVALASLDGDERWLARWIARRVARLTLAEPGFALVSGW